MSERRRVRATRTVAGVLGPFNRSPDAWRVMGAPRWMWDDAEAARVARRVLVLGSRMDGPEWGGCRLQADRVVVRRLRDAMAAAVLAGCGQLTERERELIERFPVKWRTAGPNASLVAGVRVESFTGGES